MPFQTVSINSNFLGQIIIWKVIYLACPLLINLSRNGEFLNDFGMGLTMNCKGHLNINRKVSFIHVLLYVAKSNESRVRMSMLAY